MHFITGEPRFSVHQYSRCEKVANIFAQNYSYMANGSDAPKIEVSFHLLMFAHLGGCLWCEGEGLSHCALKGGGIDIQWSRQYHQPQQS